MALQFAAMIGNDGEGAANRLRGSKRGVLTIVAIFIVGAIFVAGLFISSRQAPEEYKASQAGTPARQLRFASVDLRYDRSRMHLVIERVYRLRPDFVMLQRVSRHDAHELAQALEMRHEGTVQMFYSPNDPVTQEQPGNAVLAKWPLYQGRTMAKGHPRQFGIFVESVVEGKRFFAGSWELSQDAETAQHEAELMAQSWRRGQRLPLVVGGRGRGMDALKPVTGEQRLFASEDWHVIEATSSQVEGMPEPVVWGDVVGK